MTLPTSYESDWKMASAARVMALLCNYVHIDPTITLLTHTLVTANNQTNKVPICSFYNTMVDYINLMGDFELWQSVTRKFAFCQYPFLISMGSKMKIVEFDAKQQMETKWREAFFNMLFYQKLSMPYLILRVSRDNLIEDSLRQVSRIILFVCFTHFSSWHKTNST